MLKIFCEMLAVFLRLSCLRNLFFWFQCCDNQDYQYECHVIVWCNSKDGKKNAISVIKAFLHIIFVFVLLFVCFWRLSVKHHNYLCFLIHVSFSKDIEVAASLWGVCWGWVTMLQFGFTSVHLKLFEVKRWWSDSILQPDAKMSRHWWKTCHFYFKALLVIHLWDIILTSALPSIPSCSCKFWAWSCIAGNFDKGREDHKQKIMDRPFKPK